MLKLFFYSHHSFYGGLFFWKTAVTIKIGVCVNKLLIKPAGQTIIKVRIAMVL